MNRYTPDLIAKIERLRKGGCTWTEVAEQLGYKDRQTACQSYYLARRALGLPVGRRNRILPSEDLVARVADLKREGMSWREMARTLGYADGHSLASSHHDAVGVLAKRDGIEETS